MPHKTSQEPDRILPHPHALPMVKTDSRYCTSSQIIQHLGGDSTYTLHVGRLDANVATSHPVEGPLLGLGNALCGQRLAGARPSVQQDEEPLTLPSNDVG